MKLRRGLGLKPVVERRKRETNVWKKEKHKKEEKRKKTRRSHQTMNRQKSSYSMILRVEEDDC